MIITRVGFCIECANAQRPKTGQQFLAYGSTSNKFHVLKAERNGKLGFVPHIYKAKFVGDNVIVEKSCGMYPCGVERQFVKDGYGGHWYYFVRSYERVIWTLETWNALVMLKHDVFTKQYEI